MTTYQKVTTELRIQNNPKRLPVGDFTGRCQKCESSDLWDDNLHYGCNCCGYVKLSNY